MNKVNVIIADAGQIAASHVEIINCIPQYYAARYHRIKRRQEADQELAAGYLLRQYLGVGSDDQLIRGEHGKPELRAGDVYFNLSHSGAYVVLAIADMDIGVDIEKVMAVHWPTVRKVFSRRQQELLEGTPEPEQPLQFTRLWTEREAELKLLGTGFAVDHEPGDGRTVRSIRYKEYMITCAAYEQFEITFIQCPGPQR